MANTGRSSPVSDADIEGVCDELKDALTALKEHGSVFEYDRVVDVLWCADTLTDSLRPDDGED